MDSTFAGRSFYTGLLEALTQVMGSAKGYLVAHAPRTAHLSQQIARSLGLGPAETSEIFFAGVLADMGMVGLAEDAWENPVPSLPPEVRQRVQMHPVRSQERVITIPHLEGLSTLVRHHHEWWDGSGYPDGLREGDIPLGARILRLADTVTALGEERPHRPAASHDEIGELVRRGVGKEFDPDVARAYMAMHDSGDRRILTGNAFRHAVSRAARHVIPEEVSPLSSDQLLLILANLIDAKDPYTAGHSRRVATLAVETATTLGLQEHMKSVVWAGGYLHDLGKLRVPLRILAKETTLTDEEFARVMLHPSDGAEILAGIPSLRHLTTGARYHHERWDGQGYPEGLSGDRIPLVAQILSVCDAYDAMTSRRAYRSGRSHEAALADIRREAGSHFSPRVVEAFLSLSPDRIQHSRRTLRHNTVRNPSLVP